MRRMLHFTAGVTQRLSLGPWLLLSGGGGGLWEWWGSRDSPHGGSRCRRGRHREGQPGPVWGGHPTNKQDQALWAAKQAVKGASSLLVTGEQKWA